MVTRIFRPYFFLTVNSSGGYTALWNKMLFGWVLDHVNATEHTVCAMASCDKCRYLLTLYSKSMKMLDCRVLTIRQQHALLRTKEFYNKSYGAIKSNGGAFHVEKVKGLSTTTKGILFLVTPRFYSRLALIMKKATELSTHGRRKAACSGYITLDLDYTIWEYGSDRSGIWTLSFGL
jgi:hypothetical protein